MFELNIRLVNWIECFCSERLLSWFFRSCASLRSIFSFFWLCLYGLYLSCFRRLSTSCSLRLNFQIRYRNLPLSLITFFLFFFFNDLGRLSGWGVWCFSFLITGCQYIGDYFALVLWHGVVFYFLFLLFKRELIRGTFYKEAVEWSVETIFTREYSQEQMILKTEFIPVIDEGIDAIEHLNWEIVDHRSQTMIQC